MPDAKEDRWPTSSPSSGVSKRFGRVVTAENLSFSVRAPARRSGIVGPNGAGKSTLLSLISGVLPCDEGSISLRRA